MENFPRIMAVHSVFPSETADQHSITNALATKWQNSHVKTKVLEKFHNAARVNHRHIAMPMEKYFVGSSFGQRNDSYIDVGLSLVENAVNGLLEKTNVSPQQISQIIFTTVTGIAVPSLDARLMNRIAFKTNLKRVPMFGLGCVAGAAGIARAADYLAGHPNDMVILVALELCSLTFQETDLSVANIVSTALFGDGCAAVLLAGSNHDACAQAPKVIDSCSYFFENSERVMGFDINDQGFKIVLSGDVPTIAKEKIPPCIDQLLAKHHIHRGDVAAWIAHPGGPKVMEALTAGLNLSPDALRLSYECLAEVGNLSSASVLVILQKTMAARNFRRGDFAVLFAMGPAFCAEVVLLQW